jgi:excinuclease ABC subunit B
MAVVSRAVEQTEFVLEAEFQPTGDQPEAIARMIEGLQRGDRFQTLLGATGTGKTFAVANVVAAVQRPTLVLCHNKTLAAQLCAEYRRFFPRNAVEYFVSYYDYYQPEAYVPTSDTYIEKDAQINEEIDRLRHAATEALLTRRDVLVVASVSCIFGLGSPEDYEKLSLHLALGDRLTRTQLIRRLVDMQYMRNEFELVRGSFRFKGDVCEIYAADMERITRLEFFDDALERIIELNPVTGRVEEDKQHMFLFPASHYVLLPEKRKIALDSIRAELKERLEFFQREGKLLEYQRLKERTNYDLEMIEHFGYCKGIENYSRHFEGRAAGDVPSNLLEYFPPDFLMVVDESHVTLPQLRGMYNGDRSRKETLVEYGFRLPSALDNRPLKFEEWEQLVGQVLFTTATPGPYELANSAQIVEQVIRPTGLVDPGIKLLPSRNQIDALVNELRKRVEVGERALVTTLTKRMAESLAQYLADEGFKVHYLHSDVETVERIRILKDLRLGTYDVLVGINLLREGLDLPEVSLVAILDADKEGFLRSSKSLIQIIGRAARNVHGQVLLFADKLTGAIKEAVDETNRRRKKQLAYNEKHGITPRTIEKEIKDITDELLQSGLNVLKGRGRREMEYGETEEAEYYARYAEVMESVLASGEPDEQVKRSLGKGQGTLLTPGALVMSLDQLSVRVTELEAKMKRLAELLEFEKAAVLRDEIRDLNAIVKKRLRDHSERLFADKVK